MKDPKDTLQDRLMFGDKNIGGTVLVSVLLSILIVLVTLYLGGVSHQLLNGYKTINYSPIESISNGRSEGKSQTILVGVVFFIIGFVMLLKKKPEEEQDERNISKSTRDTYGTSRFMSREEAKKNLEVSPIQKNTGFILGKLGKDIVSLPQDTMFNRHILIMGAPGTRKSRSFVRPMILQSVKNEQSCIVTDPKGEMYRDTAAYLRSEGYDVKVFNLVETKHSDSWACLKEVDGDQEMAAIFAEVVISNITGPDTKKTEFWAVSAKNLLKAMVLYVGLDRKMVEKGKNTIGEAYRIMATSTIAELKDMFANVGEDHPAHMPFEIFAGAPPAVQDAVKHELGVFLEVFQTQTIRDITSYDEIDLEKPAYTKCAYFVIMSDQHTTLSFLSSLFFSFLFIKLVSYADNQTEDGRCPVPVNLILDEFYNIGTINNFVSKLSTVRGRYINISIIIQSLSQIIEMYGKNYEAILSCCDTHLFLGGNDPTTVKYVSDRAGIIGVDQISSRTKRQTFAPVEILPEYQFSRGEGKRNLLNQDEVYTLDMGKALVFIRSLHALKVDKFDYTEHPDAAKLIPEGARSHMPNWLAQQCKMNSASPPDVEDTEDVAQPTEYMVNRKGDFKQAIKDAPTQSKPKIPAKRPPKKQTSITEMEELMRAVARPSRTDPPKPLKIPNLPKEQIIEEPYFPNMDDIECPYPGGEVEPEFLNMSGSEEIPTPANSSEDYKVIEEPIQRWHRSSTPPKEM